jgi:hypothetical protein
VGAGQEGWADLHKGREFGEGETVRIGDGILSEVRHRCGSKCVLEEGSCQPFLRRVLGGSVEGGDEEGGRKEKCSL